MMTVRRGDIEELLAKRRKTKWDPKKKSKGHFYVESIEDNLVKGIEKEYFYKNLEGGDGNELESKFFSVGSSSALVVNTFAIFKNEEYKNFSIPLGDKHTIPPNSKFCFEKKYNNGLQGKDPNLDIAFEWDNEILAIESKLIEPLEKEGKEFPKAYEEKIVEVEKDRSYRMKSKWGQLLEGRTKEFGTGKKFKKYQYLDDTQLIKHAMGLLHELETNDSETENKKISLYYLYWEPENAIEIKEFSKHREEIEDFAKDVGDDAYLPFFSLSYNQLWESWDSKKELSEHVTNLKNWFSLSYP